MHFIIGGAYQGKRDYAKSRFGIKEEEIMTCTEDGEIRFDAPCIDRIEEFVLRCVKNGEDPTELFRRNREKWNDSVLICRDLFCGVVPMGAEMRAWREAAGRLCAYLASEAEGVTRMFCGLETRLK